jgi:hypothetical protein
MRPVAFNPANDLPPIPFDHELGRLAQALKQSGLPWRPHVGCFVWDPEKHITPPSPFPERVYFILSLPRFVELFGSIEAIQEKTVWLPTWYQARLLGRRYGLADGCRHQAADPAQELKALYRRILDALNNPSSTPGVP